MASCPPYRRNMATTPDATRGAALQTLLGAAAAVCRGQMDAASWLVDDAADSGLAEPVLAICPTVTRHLLGRVGPHALGEDPGILSCELGLACRGRFPEGSGSIGSLCLLAAAGRIDPWDPACVFALGFDVVVPVWGAVASAWFATERAATEHGRDPAAVAQRICLQIAASLSASAGGTSGGAGGHQSGRHAA